MSRGIKIIDESTYLEIIKTYGSSSYSIIEQRSDVSPAIFKDLSYDEPWKLVVTCSGLINEDKKIGYESHSSIKVLNNFIIPSTAQVILVRFFRECTHDGTFHYNADDQIIFPCTDGKCRRIVRRDAPDHFVDVLSASTLSSIGSVYSLPCDTHGPIDSYKANGAFYPIHAFSAGTSIATIPKSSNPFSSNSKRHTEGN